MEIITYVSALCGALTAIGGVLTVCWKSIKRISRALDTIEQNAEAVEQLREDSALSRKAHKSRLRRDLKELGEEYISRGYITIKELDEYNGDFETYKSMGGNGTAQAVHDRVNQLPIQV